VSEVKKPPPPLPRDSETARMRELERAELDRLARELERPQPR